MTPPTYILPVCLQPGTLKIGVDDDGNPRAISFQ